jgi:hypothetical protein
MSTSKEIRETVGHGLGIPGYRTPYASRMKEGLPPKDAYYDLASLDGDLLDEVIELSQLQQSPHPLTEGGIRGSVCGTSGNDTIPGTSLSLAEKIVNKPHVDSLLNKAYQTAYLELTRLEAKASRSGLSPTEAQMFERYVNSLKKLASEEREQRKQDLVEKMTDDELKKLAEGILSGSAPLERTDGTP